MSLSPIGGAAASLCWLACFAMSSLISTSHAIAQGSSNSNTVAWSSFQNGGHVLGSIGAFPTRWSDERGVAWQTSIEGYGQSSPVVWNDQVFVTSTSGPNKENYHLQAFGLADGTKLWQRDFANPSPEENTDYVSRAAPTPVVDAKGIVVLFEGGLLVGLNLTGETRWERKLIEDYGPIKARHGIASSLEQTEEFAFVWIERSEDPYLIAINKQSGETKWKVPGLGSTSWSTPRLVPTESGEHLVCSASGRVVGFDPNSGERLWELADIANNSTCTPVPCGVGRFLVGASDGRGEEHAGKAAESNGLVKIERDQNTGSHSAKFLWRSKKATSSFGSPAVSNNRAMLVNRSGVLFQLDLETGEELSATRVKSGSVWATPIVTAEHVYFFGQKGTTSVISTRSMDETHSNSLWDVTEDPDAGQPSAQSMGSSKVLYAAAAAPPYLILRQGDTLYAIKTEDSAE